MVLGYNPWKSTYRLWKDLKEGEDSSENDATFWGKALEGAIMDAWQSPYLREKNRLLDDAIIRVFRNEDSFRLKDYPFLHATPDGIIHVESKGIESYKLFEVKTVSGWAFRNWKVDSNGRRRLPVHYVEQVYWYMGILGIDNAIVTVLVDGRDLHDFVIGRQYDELHMTTRDYAIRWWNKYIVGDAVPPVDPDHRDFNEDFADSFPSVEDGELVLEGELARVAKSFLRARESKERHDKYLKTFRNDMMAAMENHKFAVIPFDGQVHVISKIRYQKGTKVHFRLGVRSRNV